MTPNHSLALSVRISEVLRQNVLPVLEQEFPFKEVEAFKVRSGWQGRDRIFTPETTLLTMVASATEEDKSLQNAVNIFSRIHEAQARDLQRLEQAMLEEKQPDSALKRRRGRPAKHRLRVPKSKLRAISVNTAAFSKARSRLDRELVELMFKASGDFGDLNAEHKWHGRDVYMTDGTYFQTQDTPQLRGVYDVKTKSGKSTSGYPQGLLQAIIRQSTGAVVDFRLGSRHVSELSLVCPMLQQLPLKSLVLADDLYNTYAMFSIVQSRGIDLIAPGKRKRVVKVLSSISPDDEIVELKQTARPKWLSPEIVLPPRLTLRRIRFTDPSVPATQRVIYTTLTDPSISAVDITAKYMSRWDIEITIREIKQIMSLHVARGKTPEMVFKEYAAGLTAYNLVRRFIAKTAQRGGFPPEGDLIQAIYEGGTPVFMDRKGRIYKRWSPGRYRGAHRAPAQAPDTTPT
jgi:hypothetical protein